jgi:HSP20 family molecular chaperone IbpA
MRLARSTRPITTPMARGFKSKSLANLFPRNIGDVFEKSFFEPSLGLLPFATVFSPKTNLSETETHFKISVDLPGLSREEVRVSVSRDGVLTIEGERKQEQDKDEEKDGVKFHCLEKSYGKFVLRFELPSGCEPSSIEVTFKNGVLEVCTPKPKGSAPYDDLVLEIK